MQWEEDSIHQFSSQETKFPSPEDAADNVDGCSSVAMSSLPHSNEVAPTASDESGHQDPGLGPEVDHEAADALMQDLSPTLAFQVDENFT